MPIEKVFQWKSDWPLTADIDSVVVTTFMVHFEHWIQNEFGCSMQQLPVKLLSRMNTRMTSTPAGNGRLSCTFTVFFETFQIIKTFMEIVCNNLREPGKYRGEVPRRMGIVQRRQNIDFEKCKRRILEKRDPFAFYDDDN